MLLDLPETPQTFVEDCEVCCRPLVISLITKAGELVQFHARLEQ